ncbi:hypothetical protein PsYK624_093740 [Phanerochaete sordida]|uniref:Uncharacterized protein n=1 Tax=Phanerochaete sordida TaxID=48140 RepID=A0A9P3GE97_9APHY|nr:hypothetical protein PsYK624_093740 [Phanerochaete sordida]
MSSKLLDWLKPHRSAAVARLRTNGLGLLVVFIVTTLLPLPSPFTALRLLLGSRYVDYDGLGGTWWRWLCFLELGVLGVLSLNVLQASYALHYPPAALPPPPTPAKSAPGTPKSPPQRRLGSFTPSQSQSQPQKAFSSSLYASSPISTPSRTLYYSMPSATSLESSFASSTSSFPGSPTPMYNSPLAAYRGKHRGSAGRAFDGELLKSLTRPPVEEDDS